MKISMKLTVLTLIASVILPTVALKAATPNAGIITIVAPANAEYARRPTAIALVQPADYVCACLEITSRKKELSAQITDIQQTVTALTQAAEKSPHLALHQGTVRFSTSETSSDSGKFSLSSISNSVATIVNGTSPTTVTLRVLYKLSTDQDDTLNASLALHTLVNGIKPPSQTDVRVSSIYLAVDAPDRQRERILQLIHDSSDAMQKTFSASRVTITGLEGPVLVRQVSDAQVELYIDYKLSVTTGK